MVEVKGLQVTDVLGEPDVRDNRWGPVANRLLHVQQNYKLGNDWRQRANRSEPLNGAEAACWLLSQGYLIDVEAEGFQLGAWDRYMQWTEVLYTQEQRLTEWKAGYGRANVTRR